PRERHRRHRLRLWHLGRPNRRPPPDRLGQARSARCRRSPRQPTPLEWKPRVSKVLIKSAWGSDDPTKAAFPFLHANAFAEAGHEVQVFLLGEAVSLMRTSLAAAIVPVGWPPLAEVLARTVELGTPIHV